MSYHFVFLLCLLHWLKHLLKKQSWFYIPAIQKVDIYEIITHITMNFNDSWINNYGHEQLKVNMNNDVQKVTCSNMFYHFTFEKSPEISGRIYHDSLDLCKYYLSECNNHECDAVLSYSPKYLLHKYSLPNLQQYQQPWRPPHLNFWLLLFLINPCPQILMPPIGWLE